MRYFLILWLVLFLVPAQAIDKVVLQLKWEHEFQFAGYYAALWQGYYAAEGLDVEIRPATTPEGKLLSPTDAIIDGDAHFAIGAIDILLARDRGHELAILAPLFQHNPVKIYSLPSTKMGNVLELAKLRIAAPQDNDTRAEVLALFRAQGIDLDTVRFVDVTPDVESLESGLADAIATFSVSAKFQAAERNLILTELSPSDYGLDFYSDSLFSSKAVVAENPDRVDRFVKASIKGWQYALENRVQIADRISRELPRHIIFYQDIERYNRAFASQINRFLAYPQIEIGHNNKARWSRMIEQLKSTAAIEGNWKVESLFAKRRPSSSFDNELPVLVLSLCLAILLLSLIFVRQHKRVIAPYILILVGILLSENLLESSFRKTQLNNLQLDVTTRLSSISARLSGIISSNMSIINGLAAHIAVNPSMSQEEFELYASAVFRREPLLLSVSLAPDLVLSMIYPIKSNEGALGLDYRLNKAQSEAALKVKNSGNMILAGPVNLVQGGVAFIGRAAVFIGNEQNDDSFWGIVNAPILVDKLYQAAGLLDPTLPIEIAIRGNDGLGSAGKVFYGEKDIFNDERSIKTYITVGSGVWQMAARPKQGWDIVSNDIWILRTAAFTTVLLVLLLVLFRYRQISREYQFQEQIRQSEGLLQEVGKLALIGGWKIGSDAKTCVLSPQSAETLDLPATAKSYSLDHILSMFDTEDADELNRNIARALRQHDNFDLELPIANIDKSGKWVRIIGNPVSRQDGGVEVVGAIQDITERKKQTEVINQQATYDSLTGLPNRFLFENRLDKAISGAQRQDKKLAVLFVDLDNFKPVNDHLGHKAGDNLLIQVGARIADCIRDSDTLARYSGDEFTIILHDLENDSAPLNVAENILSAVNLPFDINKNQIFCSASIGIAVYPDDGITAETLVSNADHAMYEVKKSGRNDWHYFTEAMQERSEKRHVLRTNLVSAISQQQLEVHYQPIIELSTDQITRCEALVRWTDKEGNSIPVVEFIAVAEETGLINEIDRFVLRTATQFLIQENKCTNQNIGLSVNVSPRLFSAKDKSLNLWLDLVTRTASLLDITVEITERLLAEDSLRALEVLHKLKLAGVNIAIDDFGTGYSSLSYLTKFPIDIIKIDRSFIKNIDIDHTTEILIDSIISLAQELSHQVVAEGVETPGQLSYLRKRQCKYAQGYLLGKPQDAQSFRKLLGFRYSTMAS